MKEKQAEAARERQTKIDAAKAGDKRYSLEGTNGSIITEVIGGEDQIEINDDDDDDDDDSDNDLPSLPMGFPTATEVDTSNDDTNFLKAATQFELLD